MAFVDRNGNVFHNNRNEFISNAHSHENGHARHPQLGDSSDRLSLESLNMEDVYENKEFIGAAVRSSPYNGSSFSYKHNSGDAAYVREDNATSSEEEGLPSGRQRMVGLTQRLVLAKHQQSTAEVAKHYRKAVSSAPSGRLHCFQSCMIKRVKPVSSKCLDVWHRLNFWSQQFKEIEGHCGIATTTYFRFTRWLVKINFMVFCLFLGFIYIPQIIHMKLFNDVQVKNASALGSSFEVMTNCHNSYLQFINTGTEHKQGWRTFLDIAQGTGVLENTILFYGFYSNLTFWDLREDGSLNTSYNMGLAYLMTVGLSLLVVFIMIVKNSSKTVEETVLDFDNKAFPLHTNAVFSVWDLCINSAKMAALKHKIIFNNFKATLMEIESKRQRERRTTKERAVMYLKRLIINLIVLVLLGASFYAIFSASEYVLTNNVQDGSGVLKLLINYLPSIVISALNLVLPQIFQLLSKLEEYPPSFATRITIVRAVFLRLASLWVLIVTLYFKLMNRTDPTVCVEERSSISDRCCGNTLWNSSKEPVKCWESYVGREFYKLGVFDFIIGFLVVILLKFPRRILHNHFGSTYIMQKVGKSQFDLSSEVLDIVYSQSVCWMGMFFTPLLPVISFVKVFVFFFLKKFELLRVSESPRTAYRASRSYSFFQAVLLVSFIVIACLLGYMIGNITPSKSCGPFRLYTSESFIIFDVITNEVDSWAHDPRKFIKYFGTVAFFIPAFLILLLVMYYYWAVAVGYKKMEELLKHQLKSEAQDKQYLLVRVSEINKNRLQLPGLM